MQDEPIPTKESAAAETEPVAETATTTTERHGPFLPGLRVGVIFMDFDHTTHIRWIPFYGPAR
ncbi:MAG: hypothetical protein U0166_07175 [Acidobacteriota bacterium]